MSLERTGLLFICRCDGCTNLTAPNEKRQFDYVQVILKYNME
jgi:hypothetical protein